MPRTCQICQLPPELQHEVANQHRREVPLRAIADGLREAGHPVHRDTVWRHCRNHLVDPAAEYGAPGAAAPAALTVAAVVAGVLKGWHRHLADCAAQLRAEGLHEAATVLLAEAPDMTRAALVAAAGTPASQIIEARLLASAVRDLLREGRHAEFAVELVSALRALGADELADAAASHLPTNTLASSIEEPA